MGRYNKGVSALILFLLLSCVNNAFAKTNPIPVRNQMPLYLFFLQMEPDRATVVEPNKLDIDAYYTVSNITVSGFTPQTSMYDIQIDAEVSRFTLDMRYGLSENIEAGLEVPYLSLSAGYLDSFVADFEDAIGARTPRSRIRQGSNNFKYTFIYNNQYLIQRTNASDGLGDIVLKAKYQVAEESESRFWPNISLRGAVKLPTGDKHDLLGSGEIDYGLGLALDKTFFEKLIIFTGANATFIKKPSFFSQLNFSKEIVSGVVGAECLLTDRFSMVLQVSGNSTPYPTTGTNAMDNAGYDIGIGMNYIWKEKRNVSWNFALVENLVSQSSPDVSFNTGFRIGI